ncbi:putative nuclease HARBI1 [Penaeus japonicus]|uniref:putative nuclease HARBI1 n=1 Tax=Penaeus japonicus TaxID=27405 RepID=UPI001C7132C7|nr:putative nuclease HARBI1 [Penaeus japonicus]
MPVMSVEVAAAAFVFYFVLLLKSRKDKKKRKTWVRKFLEKGSVHGNLLVEELRLDGAGFINFLRMSTSDFEILLRMVAPKISRKNTKYRKAITPDIRLAITLRYFASGDSFTSLMYTFRISKQTISTVVPEVCEALISALKGYIKPLSLWIPATEDSRIRWVRPQMERSTLYCIGAVDGKHVQMQASKSSGSLFFNYKGTHSIVFMACVNADYQFIYADVGCQGRISDGGVFKYTSLHEKLEQIWLRLPPEQPLAEGRIPVPYLFVGDDAFALSRYLLKSFPGNLERSTPERIFNYRLCRARRIVENAFGILSSKFSVFLKPIGLHPGKQKQEGL